MSKLNRDVLYMILEELIFYEKHYELSFGTGKTLYSCILVNKFWCETAVPILWGNPWNFVVKIKEELLFNVLISFLPKESRDFLERQGIYLFPTSHEHPLFDYISYCKCINFYSIKNCICKGLQSRFNNGYQLHAMEQEIYKMLVKRCSVIKTLNMMNVKHQIFHFTRVNPFLGGVTSLYCNISTNPTFFYIISQTCRSLQTIHIEGNPSDYDNLGLARLIE